MNIPADEEGVDVVWTVTLGRLELLQHFQVTFYRLHIFLYVLG